MGLDRRRSDVVGWFITGLVIWFVAAVAAVDRSGNCWSNCDDEVFIVYDGKPLAIWLGAVGTSICMGLWSLAFRCDTWWPNRLGAAVPAAIATGYLLAFLAVVL